MQSRARFLLEGIARAFFPSLPRTNARKPPPPKGFCIVLLLAVVKTSFLEFPQWLGVDKRLSLIYGDPRNAILVGGGLLWMLPLS